MIAELFYPKELKEVIKDLREKDDLNEEAFREININGLSILFVGLFFVVIIYLFSEKNNTQELLGLALLSILICIWSLYKTAKTLAIPYTLGIPTLGKIENITFGKNNSPSTIKAWRFTYSFTNSKKENIRKYFSAALDKHMVHPTPKAGDEIKIYIYPENEKYHAPFIPIYFKKFCFSKSRIKSTLNEE